MENNAMRTHSTVDGLAGLHHECRGCGGSCQGAVVELMDEDEVERIQRFAKTLSIDRAVVDRRLAQVDGACVFWRAELGCRIHHAFGYDEKPQLCKQFPLVALRAEDGLRIGVDPACYFSWQGWETGPEIRASQLVVGRVERPSRDLALERQLAHFCESGAASIASLAHWLCGSRPTVKGEGPPGFTRRIWARLCTVAWSEILQQPDLPPAMLDALNPVIDALQNETEMVNENLQASPEMSWSVEAFRRFLYLRLYVGIPTVS